MKKARKGENVIRAIIFIAVIIVVALLAYPREISNREWILYLKSYRTTLGLTFFSATIGISLGIFLAYLRFKEVKIVEIIIDEYIDIMRGTPMVLQLLIFSVVIFSSWSSTFWVAVVTLGLNSAAYVAEIVRSGIESIDKGQMEAARAIGMPFSMAMNEIVLPQAIRNILPALANEFIMLFKETSIVGYISVVDITMNSKSLQATYYSAKPIIFTGVVYYISVKFFSLLAKRLEGRMKAND